MKKVMVCSAIVFGFTLGASLAVAEPSRRDDSMGQDGQQRGQRAGSMMFKSMDANGDGEISRAEFDAAHAKRFKELDANNDGKISRDEMKGVHKKMFEKGKNSRFEEADVNHDGSLTREEVKQMPKLSENFDKVDANQDGKVTREEMDAEMKKMQRGGESRK